MTIIERYQAWRPGPLGPTKVVRQSKVEEHTSGPLRPFVVSRASAVQVADRQD